MLAVVLGGRSEVKIGSKIAKSGIITFDETPFFSLFDKVIIDIGVTSDPVPAVVGIKISGNLGPTTLSTPQISSILSFDPNINAVNFATSIGEPPPKPITPVAKKIVASSIADCKFSIDGSSFTLSKILILIPLDIR